MSHQNHRLSGHIDPSALNLQTIDPKVFESSQEESGSYQDQQYGYTQSSSLGGLKVESFGSGDFPLYEDHDQPHQLPAGSASYGMDPAPAINPQDLISSNHHSPTPPSHHLSPQPEDLHTTDWGYIGNQQDYTDYRGRRAASEISDISSAHVSPYLPHQDYSNHPSPLITAQGPGFMTDLLQEGGLDLNLNSISLGDDSHSPHMSPRLSPHHYSRSASPYQQPLDDLGYSYQLSPQPSEQHAPQPIITQPPAELSTQYNDGPVPSVPLLNIEFAPPQRQPTFPNKPGNLTDDQALSPIRNSGRRPRSISDPYAGPGKPSRKQVSRTPSPSRIAAVKAEADNCLSPADAERDESGASTKASRRLSAPEMPDRETVNKFMSLAGFPTGTDTKRVQKHPATYSCHLCSKRFTRAYNLRSHLRTHTDDRPFVCTVCGKAFARQHDRKRHEGLHTGEKRYVCSGRLVAGNTWGCNRRFARADALGRHFRSEQGRICIRPLLEEEQQRKQMEGFDPNLQIPGQDPNITGGVDYQNAMHAQGLPMALLSQYPALASIDWDTGGAISDEGRSNRSSISATDWDDSGLLDPGSAPNSNRNSFDGQAWQQQEGQHQNWL